MLQAADVIQQLASLARRRISVAAFERWFDDASWDVNANSSRDVMELVSSISVLFSLRNDGALDASMLRLELVAMVNNVQIDVVFNRTLHPMPDLALSVAKLFASPHPDPVRVWHLQPA